MPEKNIAERQKKDKKPYQYWIDNGLIIPTPGDVIDYDFVEDQIKIDAERYNIAQVGFDPHNATEIVNHLTDYGLDMVQYGQTYTGMTAPSKNYDRLIRSCLLDHGGHPVIRWMASCVEMKAKPSGDIMPDKPDRNKSTKRIDGIVADIMATDLTTRNEGESGYSIYETQEVMVI
jgi:phage terminase large subunit-like protein